MKPVEKENGTVLAKGKDSDWNPEPIPSGFTSHFLGELNGQDLHPN